MIIESGIIVFVGLLLSGLAVRVRERRLLEGDAWLLGTVGFLLAYFLAPLSLAGGAYLTPRLALFPFFGLLLWFASLRWSASARALVAAAAAAVTLASLALHMRSYQAANELLAEYMEAEPWLDAGTTVLPLHYRSEDAGAFPRVDVLAHAAAYFAVSRGTIDLVFYEGTGHGIFPISFHREVDPYRWLGDNPESVPPCVDVLAYMEQTGRAIDTVLTWKRMRGRASPCAAAVHQQLRRAYDRVHVSQPQELLEVWRLRSEWP